MKKGQFNKKEYDKKYALSHKEDRQKRDKFNILAIRKNRVDWAKANPEKVRHTKLMRKYKISLEKYNELYINQSGVCAVCLRPETMKYLEKVRQLCVDHDHETGKVRGLLCSNCNRALGLLQDSPVVCNALKEYLITNNKNI